MGWRTPPSPWLPQSAVAGTLQDSTALLPVLDGGGNIMALAFPSWRENWQKQGKPGHVVLSMLPYKTRGRRACGSAVSEWAADVAL